LKEPKTFLAAWKDMQQKSKRTKQNKGQFTPPEIGVASSKNIMRKHGVFCLTKIFISV